MGVIDRIIVDNFKSLRHVDLSLGRMNLFIGANASGKSNFLDALRVLQGVGNGFTIGEILDGKPKSATSAVWDGIRGGSPKACFPEAGDSDNPPEQSRAAFLDDLRGTWEDARNHPRMKEDVFEPLLAQHGDPRRASGGRDLMIGRSLQNLQMLFRLCPETERLRDRIAAYLHDQQDQ